MCFITTEEINKSCNYRKQVDKGGNLVIMTIKQYNSMCRRILHNTNWYRPISDNCSVIFKEQLFELIDTAVQTHMISQTTADFLKIDEPIVPTLYALSKIHKCARDPPGRLIVSGIGCLTENISVFIDNLSALM